MHETVTERFLRYVQVSTQSEEDVEQVPSTDRQFDLARLLKAEMEAMGLCGVMMDEHGYVWGEIPANTAGKLPAIGFIAHMDTAPDAPGEGVKPRIIEGYDGGVIRLNEETVIDPDMSPSLKRYVGEDLIVTDGTTLLGADDKAGVAEILTMAQRLFEDPQIPHGKIMIGFTPDEEVGRGAEFFPVEDFGADFAYTVDGGTVGEIEFENFNAAAAKVEISGVSIHPGSAKDIMKNALTIGMEFDRMLPAWERPEHTCGYEGYYHLHDFEGSVDHVTMNYILRDFDRDSLEGRKAQMRAAADLLNIRYPGALALEIRDNYRNMREKIEPHMHLIEYARKAFEDCGVTPMIIPCRGGTDGASLSFKGLPCPNLSAGGENMHSVREYVSIRSLEKITDVLVEIVKAYGKE